MLSLLTIGSVKESRVCFLWTINRSKRSSMTFLVHDVYVNAEPLLNAYCKNKNNHFVQNVFFYEWNLSLLNLHVFVMKILLIISSELVWCFKYNFFVLIFLYFSKHCICILSYWMNMPYAWMIPRLSWVLPSKNHFNLTITIYFIYFHYLFTVDLKLF